jgi:hypothetical protein
VCGRGNSLNTEERIHSTNIIDEHAIYSFGSYSKGIRNRSNALTNLERAMQVFRLPSNHVLERTASSEVGMD